MKRLIAAGAITLFGCIGIANAADLPVKAPVVKAPVVVPYSWSGFYVGLNAGAAFGNAHDQTSTVFSPTGYFATGPPPEKWSDLNYVF